MPLPSSRTAAPTLGAVRPDDLLSGLPGRMHRGLVARGVQALMRREMQRAYRSVQWHGPLPGPATGVPDDRPVVMLANHRSFHDGYLGWLVAERVLRRRLLVWMRAWDDFPLFSPMGAIPFPDDDASARGRTVRFTARRFATPGYALLYFPEGELLTLDTPVRAFDESVLRRLDRLLPEKTWLPLALHATFEGDARPILKIAAGPPQTAIDGHERAAMQAVWDRLRDPDDPPTALLLGGARSANETWNLRRTVPFFRRYLS